MKVHLAITLLFLSACILAVHAGAEGRRRDNDHHDNDHHDKHNDKHNHHNTPVFHKPIYKPIYKHTPIVYKPKVEYYCTYFYYNYCPNNWYNTFYAAVTEYNSYSKDVYGCSFGDEYNFGHQSFPHSQGGYICFRYEASPSKFWTWFYQSSYYHGFAAVDSGDYHFKTVKSYNLPKLSYTY